jgi:hypothetical protein
MKSELQENEELIRDSGGGPVKFITGAKGGKLYLTTHRIFHEPLIGKKITFSYNLDEIVDVQKSRYSMLLMIIPLFTCIKIFFKNGSHVKLNVSDKQGWIVAIKEAKK